jgi:hypothetical protein
VAIALNSWLTTGWDPILVKQGKLQMRTLVSDGSLDRAIRIFFKHTLPGCELFTLMGGTIS